ncbi:hypothetical protein [Clostridium perfringens]|uniref:hypothetical protein n=1 Tax=Clostridium perfringens TaxID=1502 RepID=UPI0024BC0B6E|nr:hypothetical protein [Clostridium perfringens]ELC8333255.1 hypothetical protein [Clostridium perfringens]
MKKIFECEKEANFLIEEFCKLSGVKITKTINNSIKSFFLPNYIEALRVEAYYILQQHKEGKIEQQELKQAISRGIMVLSKFPIKDCSLLRSIILRFTCVPYVNGYEDNRNEYVKDLFAKAESKIKEYNKSYNPYNIFACSYGDDICDHWQYVWNEKIMYDVLSSIVYIEEIAKPFTVYETITLLKRMEDEIILQYVNK